MCEYMVSIMDRKTNQPIKQVHVVGKQKAEGAMMALGLFVNEATQYVRMLQLDPRNI